MRASAAKLGDQYHDVQAKLAAEVATHSAERLVLAELRPKIEQLTSINHKLTAALAVAQLQAAVGVEDLLSEVFCSRFRTAHFVSDTLCRSDFRRCPVKRHSSRLHSYPKRRFEIGF